MPFVDQQTWPSLSPISNFGKALTGLSRRATSVSQESLSAVPLRDRHCLVIPVEQLPFANVQATQSHQRRRSKLSTSSAKKQSSEKPYRAGHSLAGPPSSAAQALSSFLK